MSHNHSTSRFNLMSDLSQFQARHCRCGVIHLAFGPVTLNLTGRALRGLILVLQGLEQELRRTEAQVDGGEVSGSLHQENVVRIPFTG